MPRHEEQLRDDQLTRELNNVLAEKEASLETVSWHTIGRVILSSLPTIVSGILLVLCFVFARTQQENMVSEAAENTMYADWHSPVHYIIEALLLFFLAILNIIVTIHDEKLRRMYLFRRAKANVNAYERKNNENKEKMEKTDSVNLHVPGELSVQRGNEHFMALPNMLVSGDQVLVPLGMPVPDGAEPVSSTSKIHPQHSGRPSESISSPPLTTTTQIPPQQPISARSSSPSHAQQQNQSGTNESWLTQYNIPSAPGCKQLQDTFIWHERRPKTIVDLYTKLVQKVYTICVWVAFIISVAASALCYFFAPAENQEFVTTVFAQSAYVLATPTFLSLPALPWSLVESYCNARILALFRILQKNDSLELSERRKKNAQRKKKLKKNSGRMDVPTKLTRHYFFKLICNNSDAVLRCSNIFQTLGSVTVCVFLDKDATLIEPVPQPERLYVLDNENADTNLSKLSLSTHVAPDSSVTLSFDDMNWKNYLTHLKPIGLTTLLERPLCLRDIEPETAPYICNQAQLPPGPTKAALEAEKAEDAEVEQGLTIEEGEKAIKQSKEWKNVFVELTSDFSHHYNRCLCLLAEAIGFSEKAQDAFKRIKEIHTYASRSETRKNCGVENTSFEVALSREPLYMSSLIIKDVSSARHQLLSKGNVPTVLGHCETWWNGTKFIEITPEIQTKVLELYTNLSNAYTLIAFAYKPIPQEHHSLLGRNSMTVRVASVNAQSPGNLTGTADHSELKWISQVVNRRSESARLSLDKSSALKSSPTPTQDAKRQSFETNSGHRNYHSKEMPYETVSEHALSPNSGKTSMDDLDTVKSRPTGARAHETLSAQTTTTTTEKETTSGNLSGNTGSRNIVSTTTTGTKSRLAEESSFIEEDWDADMDESGTGDAVRDGTEKRQEKKKRKKKKKNEKMGDEKKRSHHHKSEEADDANNDGTKTHDHDKHNADTEDKPKVSKRSTSNREHEKKKNSDEAEDLDAATSDGGAETDVVPLHTPAPKPAETRREKFENILTKQIFLGIAAIRDIPRAETDIVIETFKEAGVHFMYFSSEDEKRSKFFASKLGLEMDWNCIISLKNSENEEEKYMDETARLPRGIDNIQDHIENIDNVPLSVPVFCDCTPDSSAQMIRILQQYNDVVLCVGSALEMRNTPAFAQADISISMQPEPDHCMLSDKDPVKKNDLITSRKFLNKPSTGNISADLTSLPCSFIMHQKTSFSTLSTLMCEGRHILRNTLAASILFVSLIAALHISVFLGAVFLSLPSFSGYQILWISILLIPILAFFVLTGTTNNDVMKQLGAKRVINPSLVRRTIIFVSSQCVPLVLFSTAQHIITLAGMLNDWKAPFIFLTPNDSNSLQSVSAPVALAYAQNLTMLTYVFGSIVSTFIISHMSVSPKDIWRMIPRNKGRSIASAVVAVLQIIFSVVSLGVVDKFAAIRYVPWWSWAVIGANIVVLLCLGLLALLQYHKWWEIYQLNLQLDFETKLGMFSPVKGDDPNILANLKTL